MPFDLALLSPGEPICGLLQTSADVMVRLPAQQDHLTPARVTIPVPNVPALAGSTFHQQVLSVEFSSFGPPFRAIALSRAGVGLIGF